MLSEELSYALCSNSGRVLGVRNSCLCISGDSASTAGVRLAKDVQHIPKYSSAWQSCPYFDESPSCLFMAARCRLVGLFVVPISTNKPSAAHAASSGSPRHNALAPAREAYVSTMPLYHVRRYLQIFAGFPTRSLAANVRAVRWHA